MRYEITKQSDHYRADCLTMPGSPPCGFGKTEAEAVVHLLENLVRESLSSATPTNWLTHFSEAAITVNDQEWTWPPSFFRHA